MGRASDMRKQAVARLGEIAGYDERLDVDATLARRSAVDVLIRQALFCAATGKPRGTYTAKPDGTEVRDELLMSEVRELGGVALGRAWLLDDALQAGGLSEPVAVQMNVDDVEKAFATVFGGSDA